jgi:ketosteroid isomerase-like protein
MDTNDLQQYTDAWNDHNIDTIMSYMSHDCVFETGGGSEKFGTRVSGFDNVQSRFIEVWTDIPDVRFENAVHFVQGVHGCSEWTFTGTRENGTVMEIDGCDLFTFADGKIASKRSYVKNRV